MTAKQAFKLADSIMRYENCRYDGEDYLPNKFNYGRDVRAEILSIPDCILGAAYKWKLSIDDVDNSPNWEKGRIMKMYNEKLYDRDMLARGWHVQRPHGYNETGAKMILKRIPLVEKQPIRVT